MSAPVQIPPPRRSTRASHHRQSYSSAAPSSSSSASSSSSSSSSSSYQYRPYGCSMASSLSSKAATEPTVFQSSASSRNVRGACGERAGEERGRRGSYDKRKSAAGTERRPSLMGSSIQASTHTVINVGHPSGPPRLISCVRSSQGFDWNQEIFLPSYGIGGSEWNREKAGRDAMERRNDPVAEIRLEEEEARGLLPE